MTGGMRIINQLINELDKKLKGMKAESENHKAKQEYDFMQFQDGRIFQAKQTIDRLIEMKYEV